MNEASKQYEIPAGIRLDDSTGMIYRAHNDAFVFSATYHQAKIVNGDSDQTKVRKYNAFLDRQDQCVHHNPD